MKSAQKSIVVSVVAVVVALGAAQARADLLSLASSSAYVDHGGTRWSGSQSVSYGSPGATLAATVEWAVFTPSAFALEFGNSATSGYAPSSSELVYTYEVLSTGTFPVSEFDAYYNSTLSHTNCGTFSIPGVSGQAPYFGDFSDGAQTGYAGWEFNGITGGESSMGLAYSSLNAPQTGGSGAAYNGGYNIVFNIPYPSATPATIPEPSTAGLAAFAAFLAGSGLMFRRRG